VEGMTNMKRRMIKAHVLQDHSVIRLLWNNCLLSTCLFSCN